MLLFPHWIYREEGWKEDKHAEDTKGVWAHESLSQLIKRINGYQSKDVVSNKVQHFVISRIMQHRCFCWLLDVNIFFFSANCKLEKNKYMKSIPLSSRKKI